MEKGYSTSVNVGLIVQLYTTEVEIASVIYNKQE